MKDQILDEINEEKIHQFLEKNEKVIWEGRPISDSYLTWFRNEKSTIRAKEIFILSTLCLAGIISLASCLYFFSWVGVTFLIIVFILLFLEKISIYIQKENTRYLISENQIVFQQQEFMKKKYYTIPFYEIKNIVVSPHFGNVGVIYLAIKNPEILSFDTFNFADGKRRHQPTLEMIGDVETVAQLIRQNIKK